LLMLCNCAILIAVTARPDDATNEHEGGTVRFLIHRDGREKATRTVEGYDLEASRESRVTHVAIYDGVREQVRAVLDAARRGRVLDDECRPWRIDPDDAEFVGRRFHSWDEVAEAVEGPWPRGLKLVRDMMAKLSRARLPKPQSIRPRRVWREDDGSEVSLDRMRDGLPYWSGMQRRPVGGPRVTILVQIGANCGTPSDQLLWRGATALCIATQLEDAGYRTEILGYDYGIASMRSGDHLAQATWVKRSQDRLNLPALVNCLSGWYFRTVNFGSISLVPGQLPGWGFGSEAVIPEDVTAHLARGAVTPWVIHNVWDEEAAVALATRRLNGLNEQARGRTVVP
jgi:hypothetical protein